jgi:hypothetical protein
MIRVILTPRAEAPETSVADRAGDAPGDAARPGRTGNPPAAAREGRIRVCHDVGVAAAGRPPSESPACQSSSRPGSIRVFPGNLLVHRPIPRHCSYSDVVTVRVLPSLSESFRVFPSPSGSFRVIPSLSESFRVVPSLSGSFRVASEGSRLRRRRGEDLPEGACRMGAREERSDRRRQQHRKRSDSSTERGATEERQAPSAAQTDRPRCACRKVSIYIGREGAARRPWGGMGGARGGGEARA